MKILLVSFALFFIASCCLQTHAEKTPLRIMPLGDSITAGYTDGLKWDHDFEYGYRGGLYDRLKNAGVDFVFVGDSKEPFDKKFGDPTHGGSISPKIDLRAVGQQGHRGYGGWSIHKIQKNVAVWMKQDQPDVILLLIGINGINTDSPKQLDGLVKTIFETDNTYIRQTLVPAYQVKGYQISTVDLYSLFLNDSEDPKSIASERFSNGINHPTNDLYDQMAQRWFEGIMGLKAD